MRNLTFNAVAAIVILLAGSTSCTLQEEGYVIWTFNTGGRILSHPVINDGLVYFGSDDGQVYAVDLDSGEKIWEFTCRSEVRGSPALNDSILYIASGNRIHALDASSGYEIWSFGNGSPEGATNLDPWDYHHGTPLPYDSFLFWGCGDGNLYCLDLSTGDLEYQFSSLDSAPIRCSPVVRDKVLYFGDWNGRVYALDLLARDTLWTHKTYAEQPYPTFGQVNTAFCLYDTLLIFGARNPELQVLDIQSGRPAWSHTEKDGGWISGDPLVKGDTLFVGGSDCHKIFAFNVYTGECYWSYEFLYNNFSRPLPLGDHLLFTTGDAYAYSGTNTGKGYLYGLDRKDGSITNFTRLGGNAFTSQVSWRDRLIIGSDDGNLYAIDTEKFLSDHGSLQDRGYRSIDSLSVSPNPFTDSVSIRFHVNYQAPVNAAIFGFDGNEIRHLFHESRARGEFSVSWGGTNNSGDTVPEGYYRFEISSGEYCRTAFIAKTDNRPEADTDGN